MYEYVILFDLEPNHTSILKRAAYKTWGNNYMKTRPLGQNCKIHRTDADNWHAYCYFCSSLQKQK